jgi:hypothetical protein
MTDRAFARGPTHGWPRLTSQTPPAARAAGSGRTRGAGRGGPCFGGLIRLTSLFLSQLPGTRFSPVLSCAASPQRAQTRRATQVTSFAPLRLQHPYLDRCLPPTRVAAVVSHGLAPCVPLRLSVLGSLPGAEARGPVVCGFLLRSLLPLPAASPSPRRPRAFAFLHAERQRPRITCPFTPPSVGPGDAGPLFWIDVLYRARTRGPPCQFTLTRQPLQWHLVPTPCVDPPRACICHLTRACPPAPRVPGKVCVRPHPAATHPAAQLHDEPIRSHALARAEPGPPQCEPARGLSFRVSIPFLGSNFKLCDTTAHRWRVLISLFLVCTGRLRSTRDQIDILSDFWISATR